MRHRVLAGMALAMLVAVSAPLARAAEPDRDGRRVGVVSVLRLFNAYKKVEDIRKQLDAEFSERTKDLEDRAKSLKDREAELQLQAREKNRDALVKLHHYQLASVDLQRDFNELSEEVEKRRKEEMQQVLREVRAAIRAVAEAGNYDLVLRAPEYDEALNPEVPDGELETEEPKSANELVMRFKDDPVITHASASDLTQAVAKKLNDEYKTAE